jgi:hypothetical protein
MPSKTKEELLSELNEKNIKLKEQEHLAQAVETKDSEIASLKLRLEEEVLKSKEIALRNEDLITKLKEQQHLAKAVETKDYELAKLSEENERIKKAKTALSEESEQRIRDGFEKREKEIVGNAQAEKESLIAYIKHLQEAIDAFHNNFYSTLKNVQGAVEVSANINQLLEDKYLHNTKGDEK